MESEEVRARKAGERRENHRMALTAHLASSMLQTWGEDHPDVRKLALRSVYLADAILDVLDRMPEGSIDPHVI